MNAERKQRAKDLIVAWKSTAYALHADRMAALLQELVEAAEVEPVAKTTGYYSGHLTISTVDGRVLPAGTALYLAPPAPIVPEPLTDSFVQTVPDKCDRIVWRGSYYHLNASHIQPEPPADLVQDSVASEPIGYLYTNLQSGEYHVSDADDDYRGPERVLWYIEPVYRRTKGQQ
jgi:hypothetical protein